MLTNIDETKKHSWTINVIWVHSELDTSMIPPSACKAPSIAIAETKKVEIYTYTYTFLLSNLQ
jgi:hypothetical protein